MALRVLIVDDNAQFLRAAHGLLEREGMTVVAVASTSDEALRRLDELGPDLVLIDIDLGVESGIDLVRTIVQGSEGETPALILISAYPEEDVVDLINIGPPVPFLSKSELSAVAIEGVLRRMRRDGDRSDRRQPD